MPILTLTTDWGLRDYYVAVLKGQLLSRYPELTIVDITHGVTPLDRVGAAYALGNAYPHFPVGTVHFVGMHLTDVQYRGRPNFMLVQSEGHWFIGEDCGIFSMFLTSEKSTSWKLPVNEGSTNEELQLFVVETIVQLIRGTSPEQLGEPVDSLMQAFWSKPAADPSGIRGSALYVDHFGNVVFNVSKAFFFHWKKDRPFTILLRRANYKISSISTRYNDVGEGDHMALFNQDGLLEIAINAGKASQLLGLKPMDPILIEFHDH